MSANNSYNPSTVLILSGVRGDTRRYRTFHLFQQMQLMGVKCTLSHLTDPALPQYADRARLMILHRVPEDPYIRAIEERVRQNLGLVLVDTDDLTFEPEAFHWIDSPDFRDPVRRSLYQEEMILQNRTLQFSDAVLASTDFLAARVRAIGKLCWVHRNAASQELIYLSKHARQQRHRSDEKIIIGYASGTPTHNRDFATITSALQATLMVHPQCELWIIGQVDTGKDWAAFQDRIRYFPVVPWRELPFWLANIDINLAPLAGDNPFSQSKSEIKYMEAALVGVPTIASRTDAFEYAIRDGENGSLAQGPEDWTNALETLIEEKKREEVGQNASEDVYRRYTPMVRAQDGIRLMNELSVTLGHPLNIVVDPLSLENPPKLWWKSEDERQPTMLRMLWYGLRRRGLATSIKQIWIFFRRWLSRFIPYA